MKRTIRVGIVQQACTNDLKLNLEKLHRNIASVAQAGAQLVVLQELHNTPYFCQTEDTNLLTWLSPFPVLLPASTVSWLPDTVLYWLLRYSRSVLRGYITIQPSFLTKMAV